MLPAVVVSVGFWFVPGICQTWLESVGKIVGSPCVPPLSAR